MTARSETLALQKRLNDNAIPANFADAEILRRAQLTLHRWHELECGDGDNYKSWAIERDEETQKPYMCIYPHQGENRRYRIADKEAGAIKRVAKVCKALGANFYVQGDPRGCALYVSMEELHDNDYTRGVACIGE